MAFSVDETTNATHYFVNFNYNPINDNLAQEATTNNFSNNRLLFNTDI